MARDAGVRAALVAAASVAAASVAAASVAAQPQLADDRLSGGAGRRAARPADQVAPPHEPREPGWRAAPVQPATGDLWTPADPPPSHHQYAASDQSFASPDLWAPNDAPAPADLWAPAEAPPTQPPRDTSAAAPSSDDWSAARPAWDTARGEADAHDRPAGRRRARDVVAPAPDPAPAPAPARSESLWPPTFDPLDEGDDLDLDDPYPPRFGGSRRRPEDAAPAHLTSPTSTPRSESRRTLGRRRRTAEPTVGEPAAESSTAPSAGAFGVDSYAGAAAPDPSPSSWPEAHPQSAPSSDDGLWRRGDANALGLADPFGDHRGVPGHAERLDDLPAPLGDPLTGPIPDVPSFGGHSDATTGFIVEFQSDHEPDREPDLEPGHGPDLAGRLASGEAMTVLPPVHLTADPSGNDGHLASASFEADYPHDLRPRRFRTSGQRRPRTDASAGPTTPSGAGASRGPGRTEPDPYAVRGTSRAESRGTSERGSIRTAPPRGTTDRDRPESARSNAPTSRTAARPARDAHAARPRRRPRRPEVGLPGRFAVVVGIAGGLGVALLDLLVTGRLGVLFSLGFVLTAFGLALGVRRSDVFTAGVLPPLAALGTFAGVGLAAPERLSGSASPVVAVLAGLASESWTIVAASALALGTVAFRVAMSRPAQAPEPVRPGQPRP